MKKISLILSLFVMVFSNVLTPFVYAVSYPSNVNFHFIMYDEDDGYDYYTLSSYTAARSMQGAEYISYSGAFGGYHYFSNDFDNDYSLYYVFGYGYASSGEEKVGTGYNFKEKPGIYWTGNDDENYQSGGKVDVYAGIGRNIKIKVFNKNVVPYEMERKTIGNMVLRPWDNDKSIDNIDFTKIPTRDNAYLKVEGDFGYGYYFKEWKGIGLDEFAGSSDGDKLADGINGINSFGFSYATILDELDYYDDREYHVYADYDYYTGNYFRYWIADKDLYPYAEYTGLDVIVTSGYEYTFDDTNRMGACTGDLVCDSFPGDGWEFKGWNTGKNATSVISSPITINNSITLYPVFSKEITVNFNVNGNDGLSKSSDHCTIYSGGGTCEIELPEITPYGSNEVKGFSSGDSTDHDDLKNGKIIVGLYDDGVTYFAQSSTGITIILESNGNTINGNTTPSCTLWNNWDVNSTCQIDLPGVTAPTGKTRKGYTKGQAVYNNFLSGSIDVRYSDNNTTYWAQSGKDIEITVKPNGNQAPTEAQMMCTLFGDATTCPIVLPNITAAVGKHVLGYTTGPTVYENYTGGTIYVGVGDIGNEYYAQSSKEITINFNANGTQKNIGRTSDSCVIRNAENSCPINLPQITTTDGKTALGYTTGPTVYENPKNESISVGLDNDGDTYYAQSYKDIVFTVYPNSNTILSGSQKISENPYEVTKRIYNDVNSTRFIFPEIEAPTATPDIIGFSTGNDVYVASYQTGDEIELSNDTGYWAQTKRDYEEKTAVFLKSQGIASIGDGNDETINKICTPARTYNGHQIEDYCIVKSPKITVSAGYKPGKWNNQYASESNITILDAKTYFIAGTESNVYTIYYDLNGGTHGENHPGSYDAGLAPLGISNPTRVGYIFTGWTDQDGNALGKDITTEILNGNVALLAKWAPIEYEITFNGINDAILENGENYPSTKKYTIADTFSLATPVRTGYVFQGWRVNGVNEGKNVLITNSTGDKTATALWNTGSYTITYHLDGGATDNPTSYNYDETPINLNGATKDGYGFSGWYKNPNFVGDEITTIEGGSNSDIVLYAKWAPIEYEITFNGINDAILENGEAYPSTKKYTILNTFNIDNPIRTGYDFQGWRLNGILSQTLLISNTTGDKDITAEWTPKRYTITYYPNGGTNNVNNPESYTYSSTSSIPLNDAERVGYHFDGWYTEAVNGEKYTSIPEGAHVNYVFYAHWTANTNTPYKVYHYQESLDGGYLLKDTDSLQGTSNDEVTPAVKTTYDGFEAPSTQTVTIRPDGETRVEYKYNRISYSITVNYDGGKDVNNQSSVTYTKKYGDTIEELIPTKAGYSFNGWDQTYPKTMPVVAGTKTIKATWTPTDYTITYNNVEYADNSGAIYGYNATTQPITLNDAYWTGYIFDGWYTQAVGGTQVTAITANDHENKVLYAHWTPKTDVKYIVIHRRQGLDQYYNDDSLKEEVEYTNGVTATTIEAEQKNYPGFIPPEVKEITIKGDGTSVVEYRYQRMRFTYASEGAVGVDIRGTTANNQYMFYDYPLTLRASVATGYTWSHWSVNTGDGEYRTFTTEQNTTIGLPAYDSIVRPVVTHNEYTLSFNTFGGVATGGSSIADQTHYYDDEITLPVVVKTGYIFQGWYTEANGQGTRYEADTRMPSNSIELKAYWIPGEVNVKVEYYLQNVDGSTYPEQPSDVLELHKLTESIYTGELKTYEGFTTPAEKSVEVLPDGTSVIRYDYARNSYTLDLNTLTGFAYVSVISTNHPEGAIIDESGAVQSANYYYGEMITVTGELLTGYGMDKWNGADIIGTNSNTPTLTFTMPAQSVELTPNVTKNKYRVTYKDGDRVLAIYDVEYEDVIPTPTAPSKYGYKFTGWNPYPVSGTMPAKALELQAMWESVPISGGSGGGGGGSSINKDDTKKTETEKEHNSAELTGATQEIEDKKDDEVKQEVKEETKQEETVAPINTESNQPVQPVSVDKEVLTAYEWAYKHDVTTMPTLNDANPEGVVTRGHLAKMVVNYATNVLGYTIPEKIPSECRWNDGRKDWESQEIKDYAVKSCALGLMGLDMPKFLPNMTVTRAQFGTIMSRLLWGKKYAGGKPYYRKHLNALKESNIMTQIENPEKRTELRQWVWLMLMRAAEEK